MRGRTLDARARGQGHGGKGPAVGVGCDGIPSMRGNIRRARYLIPLLLPSGNLPLARPRGDGIVEPRSPIARHRQFGRLAQCLDHAALISGSSAG